MLISIVIPCYNSEKMIRKEVELILAEFEKNEGYECELVLVNDGSRDDTFGEIRRLGADYPNVCGVNLMRNFGQHNALMAALHYTNGDFVMGMDDDMQTHPSQMFKLIHKLEEGYDLVYGVYPVRKNSPLKNFTSLLNKVSSRVMLGRPKEIVSSNFWIITSAVRDEVVKYDSFNPYIDAIFYRVTHNIGNVEIEHFKREVGSSNYTFKKLVTLWLAYWNFSVIPLRVSFYLGLGSAAAGVLIAIWLVINKIMDPDIPVGWSSTVCVMVLFFGLVLLMLGVVGEYLGKIILILNNTPQYIVRETVNAPGSKSLSTMVKEITRAEAARDEVACAEAAGVGVARAEAVCAGATGIEAACAGTARDRVSRAEVACTGKQPREESSLEGQTLRRNGSGEQTSGECSSEMHHSEGRDI